LGLIFAWFLNEAILLVNEPRLSDVTRRYGPLIYVVFTIWGWSSRCGVSRRSTVWTAGKSWEGGPSPRARLKVVDTSAIIDGRIADVYETKFLSGTIIVGRFILKSFRTSRTPRIPEARPGPPRLDILQRLQDHPDLQVKVVDKDYPMSRTSMENW